MTNLVILSSHATLEYDDLRLFSRLGYDVFMPGAYADPRDGNGLRPPVPEAPYHPEFQRLTDAQREKHAGESIAWPVIDWGKADLHPDIVDWADVIMVNCFPESWIAMQWPRIRHKRVIWRTIGQSDPPKEQLMRPFRLQGLEIVRYSPAERRAFEALGVFAGEDAVIRFGKDPADYGPWVGDNVVVGNLAQHDTKPGQRDPWLNWPYVLESTEGLPREFVGTNAETVGGRSMEWDELRDWLRHIRCLIYTGTQPASYTLGLMEAMLTGVPIVSVPKSYMWMPDLFEADEIVGSFHTMRDPQAANDFLRFLLRDPVYAQRVSEMFRSNAIDLFGYDTIGAQWVDFLGAPAAQVAQRLEGTAA